MNSRSKPTTPRKSGSRARKPATIDLEAKKTDADNSAKQTPAAKTASATEAVKKTAATKVETSPSKEFGRAGSTSAKPSSDKAEPAKTPQSAKKEEAAASKPDPKKETPAPASTGKSGGGLFSGLVGATAAVVGLGAVGQMDGASDIPFIGKLYSGAPSEITQPIDPSLLDDLNKRIDALQTSNDTGTDLAPFNEKIAALEETIASLQTNQANPQVDEVTATRLSAIETELSAVNETISSIAKAAENGETAGSGEIAAALSTVSQRMDGLESKLAEANPADQTEIATKIETLETQVTSLAETPAVDLTPLQTQIADLETSIASIKASVETNSQALGTLTSQSSELQETVASVKASEKVARSVAINALGSALENDDPINLALSSLESLGGKTPETERLTSLATEGIPTRAALLSQLTTFTDGIQNPKSANTEGTLSERFWANARNLVSFRSSGPKQGNTAIAILSRVQAAVESGDLETAKTEWSSLPSDIQVSGEGWLSALNKRLEAFAIYKSLSDQLAAANG